MAKKWSEVIQSNEYQALSPDEKESARNQYFDSIVAPNVPEEDLQTARSQFDSATKESNQSIITFPTPDQSLQMPEPGQQIPISWESTEKMHRAITEGIASGMGAAAGTPFGLTGQVAGSGLVGGGMRTINDIIFGSDITNVQEGMAKAGFDVLDMAAMEAAAMTGSEILTQTGRGLWEAGKSTGRFLGKVYKISAEHLNKVLAAHKLRIPLTVGELMDSSFLKGVESLVRKVITPTGKVKTYDDRRIKRFIAEYDDYVRQLTGKDPTPREINRLEKLMSKIDREINNVMAGKIKDKGIIGQKLKQRAANMFGLTDSFIENAESAIDVLVKRRKQFRDGSIALIEHGKNIAPDKGNSIISTKGIIPMLDDAIEKAELGLKTVSKTTVATLKSIKEDFIKRFPTEAPSGLVDQYGIPIIRPEKQPLQQINLDEFLAKRRDLNDILAGTRKIVDTQTGEQVVVSDASVLRLVKPIKDALDNALERWAKETGNKEVHKSIMSGIGMSRHGFNFTDIPTVKKLLKTKPEDAAKIIIRAGKNAATQMYSELNSGQRVAFKKVISSHVLGLDNPKIPISGEDIINNINDVGEGTIRTYLGDEGYNSLMDLGRKLISLNKGVIRRSVSTTAAGRSSLGEIAIAGNKFFKSLLTNKRPENIINIIYHKETTKGIRRTYDLLNKAGRKDLIQELKVALLDDAFRFGTREAPTLNTTEIIKRVENRGIDVFKSALSKKEFESFNDIYNVIKTVNVNAQPSENKILRIIGEILGLPASLVLFRDRTAPLVKRAIKLATMENNYAYRKELNTTILRLSAISAEALYKKRLIEINRENNEEQ